MKNFLKWGLKRRISIDADSGPLRYVLWCCGNRSQEEFSFIQFSSGNTVSCSLLDDTNGWKQTLLQVCTGILLIPNYTKHGIFIVEFIMSSCIFSTIGFMIAIKKKHHTENKINQQGPKNLDSFWLNAIFAILAICSIVSVRYLNG